MNKLDEEQTRMSNTVVNWAHLYDIYEIEFREMYQVASKPQNESHFEMMKSKGARFLNKESTFCEIGFSAGLTLRYMYPYFRKIIGLDISPKNVEFTQKELDNEGLKGIELYTSDLMKFDPRFENCFDVISFIHGLEHFTLEDYPTLFFNIRKYLRPGGVFTGALPYNQRFNYRICPECGHTFEVDGHVSSHTLDSLKKVFEDNGFRIIHLDNYNLNYAIKFSKLSRKIFGILTYYLFNRRPPCQIEYIVTPK